ncbi:MAG: cyclopropane-fatty-acyl-phospholipid synthase [Nevskia sp.]|nr:cyclopropane-fatty-acyl-phospholipid synthase [Nevskia sp.]
MNDGAMIDGSDRRRRSLTDWALAKGLKDLIKHGRLDVITAAGNRLRFGDGSGAAVEIRFTDAAAQWGFMIDPELRLGEIFTDSRLLVERGTIYDFLMLVLSNIQSSPQQQQNVLTRLAAQLRFATRRQRQHNTSRRAQRNVARHYDLGDQLYALFLDDDWQYSCAYFETPELTLEQAQAAKKRHIAAKLLVDPGHAVLDIGCGWGGLALYLAESAGAASVTGVTLSEEQLARARHRADQRGLADRVRFQLQDYRKIEGQFDRIVSVGMFEHVGLSFYDSYFENCQRLLKPDGVMLLHTIGCSGTPSQANPWLDRYIFPGGYLPTLSEMMPAIERAGLVLSDLEVWRLHYAQTLRIWRERFMARRDEAARLYDERFCRMWEFYLAFCEAAFRCEDVVVFQLQLARRNDSVPLSRDYIDQRKAQLRQREARLTPAS